MPEPCPMESQSCKYFQTNMGCFESKHHIYRQSEADTPLRRTYSNLGGNIVRMCRLVHDSVEAEIGGLPWPEVGVMEDIVSSEAALGHINLSRSSKKRLGM